MSPGRNPDATGLSVIDLEVRYGQVAALRDITFTAPHGRLLAVTGPSGGGKSSLVWALAGALSAYAGTAALDGTTIRGREQAAAHGIALIPQGHGLVATLTAEENILVPLLARKVALADAEARVTASLTALGLQASGRHLIEELSGGQQQRVAIARAIAGRPTLLLADEPTSDLDEGNRQRVLAALRQEADAGAIVLLTTHDPETAAYADDEIHLDEGSMSRR